MKARWGGVCGVCYKQWYKDSDIVRWVGKMTHRDCKDREVLRIAAEGQREVLPDNREAIDWWPSRKQALRPAPGRTRGIKKLL